jgi:CDP-diacylglycerol--glycerol-3-phosphate 3-phosphatidyltransferase
MRSFHESLVGKTLPVLVDGYDAEAKRLVARTWADAPEVDGRVLLPKGSRRAGAMLDVTITKAHDYELEGALVAADGKAGRQEAVGRQGEEAGMNLPNTITLLRLVLTAGVFVCLEWLRTARRSIAYELWTVVTDASQPLVWIAFVFFLIAAFTDFLDGYLARKWNLVTAFGRVADPFADKVLIAGSLVTLLQFPAATTVLTTWYVVVVIAREFLVTAIRGVVEASGQPFPADRLGKWKMVSQCWTVGALLTMVAGTARSSGRRSGASGCRWC